jgi:alkanesulfonate monooxygenase SsuD/methylene tetrahydromethanopterin reductase-like flavin-dependent oxidoreductase (luciferase family)
MRFGLALPNQVVGTTQHDLAAFVERAERLGFDSIWAIDRLVFDGYLPLPLLAWVAGQTEKVSIGTSVILATLYSPLMLAKEAATIDRLSSGRLMLGLGIGAREDDFEAAFVPIERRDRRIEETVALLRQTWSGQPIRHEGRVFRAQVGPIGPSPARDGGPPILMGGYHPNAIKRAARLGDGYTAGGGPELAHKVVPAVRQAVQELGRDPARFPCFCSISVSIGSDLESCVADVENYQLRYFGQVRADPRQTAAVGTARDVAQRIHEYDDLDLDTLTFLPVTADPEQVDRLAEVVHQLS